MIKPLLALSTLFLLLTAVSCSSPQVVDNKADVAGKWTTDKVRVKINSLDNTERDSTIIVSSENFKSELGIESNIGYYYPDGTYKDIYYANKDSVLLETSGKWMMQGADSLVVRQEVPTTREHIYFVKFKRDKGIFKGLVDWDGDGKQDDEFVGIATKDMPKK